MNIRFSLKRVWPLCGMCYSFFDRTEARRCLRAPDSPSKTAAVDLWKRDAQEHHAWCLWIRKPTAEPNTENDQI